MAPRKTRARWLLDWPLLGKELREQAARKQMYVIRVVYALVLFGAFFVYYERHLAEGPVLALGGGAGPFGFLVAAQLFAIYVFLPPLMVGAIAQEKERETLGLLFLTDLTPWELILQKYVGRLIPMLTLLFLSLPLLAVAYSLGGVSAGMLYSSAAILFLTCLWVGAVALACSAHEASTFQALFRCWAHCLAFAICCWLTPLPFLAYFSRTYGTSANGLLVFLPTIFTPVVYLALTWYFLAWARQVLETRAFVQRRNPFGQQFKQLDQYWKDLRKLLRALSRKRDPEANAIAAQVVRRQLGARGDQHTWSLGGFLLARMQIPHVLSLAIIFGVIVLLALIGSEMLDSKASGGFAVAVGGLWIFALLTVPIQSANAVASERINERLGVILTTPMTAREIFDEWLAPVRRWIQFLARPLIVVFIVEALVKLGGQGSNDQRWANLALYMGISLLTVWIYPALVQWLCFWIGLRVRHQVRALMTSLLLVVAWCVLPLFAAGYLVATGLLPAEWSDPLRFISPIYVVSAAEALGHRGDNSWVTADVIVLAFVHLAVAAALLWWFRRLSLTNANRYLGRV